MKKNRINNSNNQRIISLTLEEPLSAYNQNQQMYSLHELSPLQKMQIILNGITKSYLEKFKKYTDLDYESLSEALSITRATLINKKSDQTFNELVSEKIVSLADIYAYGYSVFNDKKSFNQWIKTPNDALDGVVPFSIINNIYGKELVRDLIGRIEYGIYS